MHALPEFTLLHPADAAQAAAMLGAEPLARLVAGGTDLLPNLRRGLGSPPVLIDVSALPSFASFEAQPDGGMRLGAGLTLATISSDAQISRHLPALAEAAAGAAGPGHRSAATLGGNLCQDTRCSFYNQSEWWRATNGYCLKYGGDTCHVAPQGARCHAAFSGDLAPVLLALDAEVELLGTAGTRRAPLHALYRDDGAAHLTLAHDELLVAVHVPALATDLRCAYRKARVRGAMDFPLAGVAAALALQGGAVTTLAIGITGTNSHPLRLAGTEAFIGKTLDEAMLGAIVKLVHKQVSPMRSTVTPSNYRRQVAGVLAQRLLRELAAA